MKLNEITVGQKIKYGTPYGDTTGFVHAIGEDTFDVSCECLLGGIARIKKDTVISTVETVITEKDTKVEHPRKMEFLFQPQEVSFDFGYSKNFGKPSGIMKGFAKDDSRIEFDVRIPAFFDKAAEFNGKGFKVTIEENQ
jgi:hypothetical protein